MMVPVSAHVIGYIISNWENVSHKCDEHHTIRSMHVPKMVTIIGNTE